MNSDVIMWLTFFGVIGGMIGLGWFLLYGFKKYDNKVITKLNSLIASHGIVDGPPGGPTVKFYVIFGLFHWTKEVTLEYHLSRNNSDSLLDLCSSLRRFCFRNAIFAKGMIFVPFMIWWNYSRSKKVIIEYQRNA